MKSLISIAAGFAAFISTSAFAYGPTINVVPVGHNGFGVPYTQSGPALALAQPEFNTLNVYYSCFNRGGCLPAYNGAITVGLKINGRHVRDTRLGFVGRGAIGGNISLQGVENGNLELYFYDDQGRYDSDFGRNWQFTLQR